MGFIASVILTILKIGTEWQDIVKAIALGCALSGMYILVVRKRFVRLYKEMGSY